MPDTLSMSASRILPQIIKFNHLVANCVILYNVFVVSKELQKLALDGTTDHFV